MNWAYAFALFESSLAAIILAAIAWRRRSVPGGWSLTFLAIAMVVWSAAYACYWLTADMMQKTIWFNVTYLGVLGVPVAFLLFSVRYTIHTRWFRKRSIFLLAIVPVATLILIWTDPLHGLFYAGGTPDDLPAGGGVWFWVNLVYSYGIVVFSFALLVRAWSTTVRPLRSQLAAVTLGALVPLVVNLLMILGYDPFPGLDLTAFAFTFSCICLVIGFSRFHLLDIIPIARSVAIDRMTDGFIVLDAQDRVVDVNRSALVMLGKGNESIIGLPASAALDKYEQLYKHLQDPLNTQQEICLVEAPPVFIDLRITPLFDKRGAYSGRLIVARDITDRKRAEQAEHEQRVLAEALSDSATALNRARSFEDVMDRILDHVGRVVPYHLATFLLAGDRGSARLVRERGYRDNGMFERLNHIEFVYENIPNFQKMVLTGKAVVIADTWNSSDWVRYEGMENIRSYVGAPIRVRDIVVGFVDLASFTPGFYTQVHAERLQAFADQAAIAIENARLLEQAHQRADELVTLLEFGLAATSGLDLDELLQALLEKCKRVLPIEVFYIATYDNNTQMIEYPLFYDKGEISELESHIITDTPGLTGWIIQNRQPLYIPDALDEAAIQKYNIFQVGGDPSRSYAGVPLMLGKRVVGVISIQSSKQDVYHPEQIRLLETIATQVAGAIENARLFKEVRLRAEEMTALFDIGITVTSGLDMDQVLKTLLEKCRQVLPVEAFYIAILEPESGLINHPLAFDEGEYPHIPTRDINKNPGLSGHIIKTRKTLYIPDMASPDAIKTYQIFRTSGKPTQAYVGVPMIVGERVVGVISMQSYKTNAYDRDHIRLLETIATQAAFAIENSRLYAKAQQEIMEREKAERRYRALFEQSHDAVFIIDFEGRNIDSNQRACGMLGYSAEEIQKRFFYELTAEHGLGWNVMERLQVGEHLPLFERRLITKHGGVIIAEINAELVRDIDGTPLHIQLVVRDISERKEHEQEMKEANEQLTLQIEQINALQTQLREQALRDPLTNLYNRRYLDETLEREFSLANRQGTTVCLVMIDIDGFKGFNDTYGHDAGDHLLKQLGDLLCKEVRSSDISCRFGGEEFLVVMPGAPIKMGYERAEHLRKAFCEGKFQFMGVELTATLSLGVAIYPEHGKTWQEVLHTADRAMYAAKAAGRNQVHSAGD